MTFRSPIHIRFSDLDVMGHVNNAVYFNYFEQARMAWFEALIGSEWDWHKAGVILARNEIDYKLPLLLNDDAEIETTVEEVGKKSLTMRFNVVRHTEKGDQTIAIGKCVLVCFDHKLQQTVEVPAEWRSRISTD